MANVIDGLKFRWKQLISNPYKAAGLSLFKIKYLKHIPVGKERVIKICGKPFFYTSPQELVHAIDEIFVEGIYDQVLSSNSVILDCGANVGVSVIRLKQLCPTATITAFEPDHANFELLTKNIMAHGLSGVNAVMKAVWTEETTLSFVEDGSMSSRIVNEQEKAAKQVAAVRLRDYLESRVDFLKMDIEGAEYQVIKDIEDRLGLVQRMFIEYHGSYKQNDQLLHLLEMVTKAGFQFYIKEATSVYDRPFVPTKRMVSDWDVRLNIFCIRPPHL